jgi:hypothetical protein
MQLEQCRWKYAHHALLEDFSTKQAQFLVVTFATQEPTLPHLEALNAWNVLQASTRQQQAVTHASVALQGNFLSKGEQLNRNGIYLIRFQRINDSILYDNTVLIVKKDTSLIAGLFLVCSVPGKNTQ